MQKIETVITRDNSLIDVNAWHKGYTSGLKKWLGWSYSDTLFYVHDGYVEIMRPPHEHLIEFRDYMLGQIDADPSWFKNKISDFDVLIKEIYDFYDVSIMEIGSGVDKKKISKIYSQYVSYIEQAMGPFIMFYWIPVWIENDPTKKSKYEKEMSASLEYRKKIEHLFPRGAELSDLILKLVEKETGIHGELLRVLSPDELFAYLDSEISPNNDALQKRLKGFVYSKKGVLLTDNTPENLIKVIAEIGYEYVPKVSEKVKEIKGQVACQGKVIGKVRVIMSKKDISAIEDGEILVASMTTPEYVPAMKKAAAFVTDEGGITCHAAIIAREMAKPCIIGAKIATKVLKTGNKVEVDANSGIVRIIT